MLTILHVSDLHFGPPYIPQVGESVLHAAELYAPDVIVASGDFTQRATAEQFQQARRFLDALPPVPLMTIPGNHDVPVYRVWERLTAPYRNYQEHLCQELEPVIRVDGACLVGLNSTAPLRTIVNGRIRREQLDRAAQVFRDEPPEHLRVIVAHHHFAPAPDYERANVMPRARRALDRFEDLDVELILGGHLHRAYIGNSLDIYAGKSRDTGIIIVQCGTTTSQRGRAREREKNSFNLIQVYDETVVITHFMYFSDAGRFEPISRHEFPRRRLRHLGG